MKYYIIAGEASGDLHGSNLMKALLQKDPQAEIRFWGGDKMQKVGGALVKHIKDLAFMGYAEVALHLKTILGNMAFCKKDILEFQPDAMIFIDYPGFNLKIAEFTKSHGFKNYYYISPQVWAWKKGRIKKMRAVIDKLYCILPFERKFYEEINFEQAVYVGHPLLDEVSGIIQQQKGNLFREENHIDEKPIVALLPGSRKQELSKMLPYMVKIARRHPEFNFVIAGMKLLGVDFYNKFISGSAIDNNIRIVFDQTYNLLQNAHSAIVCSGTATLETALFNVPQVVCYRANAISVAIARRLIKGISYISLVNLVSDKEIVKELIQDNFNNDTLENEFLRIATDEQCRKEIINQYAEMRAILGNDGASSRVADSIINDKRKS